MSIHHVGSQLMCHQRLPRVGVRPIAASSRKVKFDDEVSGTGWVLSARQGQLGPPTLNAVSRYEYDEEASAALHMDVVHEVPDDRPVPVTRWVEAMRRL